MKSNTIKPVPERLGRTLGENITEEVLSSFWLYAIGRMGTVLDDAQFAQQQFAQAAQALSLSAECAPLGAGLAASPRVQVFQECAMDLEEALGQVEALSGLLRRAVRGCEDGRGDFKLKEPQTRALLFSFLRENPEAWQLLGETGYDWATLARQARAKHRS